MHVTMHEAATTPLPGFVCFFGISSAPEELQRRILAALHGLGGVSVVADDILVFGCGDSNKVARLDHEVKLVKLLERAREKQRKK